MNPQTILILIAIIMAAASYVWPHLLAASVIILGVSILTTGVR